MKRHLLQWSGVCVLISVMLGCGMTGTWTSKSLEPEIARNEFSLFGQKPHLAEFTRAEITIRDDGSYTADAYYGDLAVHSTGTWEKHGDQITFVDTKGISKTYDAELSGDHKELVLVRSIEGTKVRLVLTRKS